MSNKTTLIGAFIAGVAVGALTTYKIVRDKYEKLSRAEAESFAEKLKELRKNEVTPPPKQDGDVPSTKTEDDMIDAVPDSVREEYERTVKNLGYTDYASASVQRLGITEPIPVKPNQDLPQVIDPDEFGEYDDYRVITLLYFADRVLSDHDGNMISNEEAAELLGPDALDRFGEYEEDAVHVRNDARKCYYEVLMESRLFSDLLRKKPYIMHDDEDEED